MFSIRGFEALFPRPGTLGCAVYLIPQLFLPAYSHVNVGLLALLATLPHVLSTQLPVSTPPTSLDECFFFNSLVVGLPYSSIFCQLFLDLLLFFFWLCKEAECIYLRLHLSQKFIYF